MCDYSLGGLPNRLAVEGEELVVHRFRTGSIGLASPAELHTARTPVACARGFWSQLKGIFESTLSSPDVCAVCVPPGARLTLDPVPPDFQRKWNLQPQEKVVFTQTSADVNRYRDAFEFSSGLRVLLQGLQEGMRVRIESLGTAAEEPQTTEAEFDHANLLR